TTAAADAAQVQGRADAMADLQALLAQAPADAAFMQSLAEDLQLLAHKAPVELGALLPELQAIRNGDVSALVQAVTPALMAQLAQAH
nr:DNA repair exonuclease [Rubrivivax sp.]